MCQAIDQLSDADQQYLGMFGSQAGQGRNDNGIGMQLVWCPPGKGFLGTSTSSSGVVASVSVHDGFWCGKFEVSQAQWRRVMGEESGAKRGVTPVNDHFAATAVNWKEADEFCRKLTLRERQAGRLPDGWVYRLPGLREWEYACRAGSSARYCFGNDVATLREYAWYKGNADEPGAGRVGRKLANRWGLHDVHGNVREWCWNIMREGNVCRGGSLTWSVEGCSTSYWEPIPQDTDLKTAASRESTDVGLRVVLALEFADRPELGPLPALGIVGWSSLIKKEPIQNGLKLDAAARKQIGSLSLGMAETMVLGSMAGADSRKLEERYEPFLFGALNESQRNRLRQICWQMRGSQALTDGMIVSMLGLSQTQTTKLKAIDEEFKKETITFETSLLRKKLDERMARTSKIEQAGGQFWRKAELIATVERENRQAIEEHYRNWVEKRDTKSFALLSAHQRSEWTKLIGEPFDVSRLQGYSRPFQLPAAKFGKRLLLIGSACLVLALFLVSIPFVRSLFRMGRPPTSVVEAGDTGESPPGARFKSRKLLHLGTVAAALASAVFFVMWWVYQYKSTPSAGSGAGDERTFSALDLEFCWCPSGSFATRDDTDVELTRGYWLGKYEVTWGQYQHLAKGERQSYEGDNFPVGEATWDDATEFCRRLTVLEREAGRLSADWEYRLPTDAQWEYGSRARANSVYSFGDDPKMMEDYGWISTDSKYKTHAVGQKKSNAWGLCDMYGNVSEWCRDFYSKKALSGKDPENTTVGSTTGLMRPPRVQRGGGYSAQASTCLARAGGASFERGGFRIALVRVEAAGMEAVHHRPWGQDTQPTCKLPENQEFPRATWMNLGRHACRDGVAKRSLQPPPRTSPYGPFARRECKPQLE